MKTISSRFLKGTLAMLLAVIMVFGTTLTGFAAVVDNAETDANVDIAETGGNRTFAANEYFYLKNYKPSGWGDCWITSSGKAYLYVWGSGYSGKWYPFELISGTAGAVDSIYGAKITTAGTCSNFILTRGASNYAGGWNGSTGFWNQTADQSYDESNLYNGFYGLGTSGTSWTGFYYAQKPASVTATVTNAISGSGTSSEPYLVYAGDSYTVQLSATKTDPGNEGFGWNINSSSSKASSGTSSTYTKSYTAGSADTTTTYTGYAWCYEKSTDNYSPNYTASNQIYVKSIANGYSYTVTAGEGGTVSPTSGTASSVEITATPNTGYAFDKWTCTNGSVANASSATTTFTPSANGATATASFKKLSYTVTASASPSAGGTATVTTSPVEYGGSTNISATAKTGYRFTGWTRTSGTGTFGNASSASTTYSPTSNSVLSANFSKIDYSITVNESGATGTVNVANTAQYGDSVSLSVTPPENYKIASITIPGNESIGECESYTGSFTMPANDVTITVTYALNGTCKPVFAYGDRSIELGASLTNKATINNPEYCPDGGNTISYSSSAPTIVGVDSNGKITAYKLGSATITATCSCGSTASYKATVKTPVVTVADMTLDVNGTAYPNRVVSDGPSSGSTMSYSTTDTDIITVGASDGFVTAKKPGTATVSFAMTYGGETVATGSFNVTVKTPTVSITPNSVNLLVGQTMTDAFATTSSVTAQSVTLTTNAAGVATVSGGKATARGAGTATITASFKYNDSDYRATATATVNVVAPTISADKASVTLEYGGGTTTQDVTITTNADKGNGTGDDITVSSANSSIATATVSGNTVTIEAKSIGSTTVTAKFHDATVEIPVTVKAYDPCVYLYVTDAQGWGDMYLHAWIENGDNDTVVVGLTGSNSHMTYIGKNSQKQNIFAYKFEKTNLPTSAIFVKSGSWPGTKTDRTGDNSLSFGTNNYQALYIASATDSSGYRTVGDWTSSCSIVRPTVSVADVVVPVADTATATATVTDGDKVLWTVENTSVATVNDVETQTATVTGVTPGETKITARAFLDTANSSIKTLPTNYKTENSSWEFISTEATANVNVGSVDYTINANASYSANGSTYNDGDNGGTVKATVGGNDYTAFPIEVAHGTSYTLTATEKAGYRFVEWVNGNGDTVSTEKSYTVTATAAASYKAKFVKTVKVSVALTEGIASVTYNGVTHTEGFDNLTVDAGSSVEISATAKSGYIFTDWTVTGATVADTTANPITISNIQSSLTVTAKSAPLYTASAAAYTNKLSNTNGGTVTIDGKTSPVSYKAGDTVNFEAHASTNYYFAGWYSDADFTSLVSADANYQTTMTASGITLYGLFVKHYYIDGAVVGNSKVELNYNVAANTYSVSSNSYAGNAFTVKDYSDNIVSASDVDVTNGTHTGASVSGNASGYTLVPDTENYDPTANILYTLTPDSTFDGSYNLNITLTPATKVEISVNGTKVADKAVGSKFSYEITPPAGQYLSGATMNPVVDDFSIDGNTVTFTVPNQNVNIVPQFANYSYVNITDTTGITLTGYKTGYKIGEAVDIKLSPATAQVSIVDVTSDNNAAVVTKNADGTWSVAVASMPADTTITLTPTIDAKFAMNSGVAVIGNYGTGATEYGKVEMSIDGKALAEGGYAEKTDTVTYTATAYPLFIFDGFYSDAECTPANLLTRNSTYNVTPTEDTTVYALFARRQYLACDLTNYSDSQEMTYVPADRAFTLVSSTISKSAEFRVTNKTDAWVDGDSYSRYNSADFNVSHNQKSSNVTVSWGTERWKLTSSSDAEYPYTFILTLDGNRGVDMSVKAAKSGYSVFLSSGRVDVLGSYDSAVFDAESVFTTEGLAAPTDETASHDSVTREKYKKLKIAEAQTLSFQTTLTGTSAANYYIDSYVVYFIEDETYEIVTPFSMGENVYTGSVYAKGDCYIVPIYFLTDEYATTNNLSQIEIYFDASAIKDQAWGPFVACYAWGTNASDATVAMYFGGWSGQMMIPSADGKSFFTQLTVPKSGDANATSIPNGVTFNNYMQATCVANNAGAFGVPSTQYQCYDYREPITLYEAGYDVITFVAKDSTDGYHGDRANGVTSNPVSSSTTDIFTKFNFDYLYCRDGVTPMDLNGNAIDNPVDLSTGAKADYYVITKGDITYDPADTKYVGDSAYDADWSVDWYVFDSNGEFITSILSTALWHDIDNNLEELYTYLHQALGVTSADVAGKTVAISYEHENNANHQVSYDGQWYGNYLGDSVTGQVVVGLQNADGTFTVNEADPLNNAAYGEGYLKDIEGGLHQTLDIKLDYGRADLTAAAKSGYRFLGWYTKQADGSYVQILKAPTASTYINMNETYFAMFKAIGASEVVINHRVYENDDPVIPAHNGVGQLSVIVYDSDGNVVEESTPNTSSSTVVFEAEELKTYTIKIKTTPLMNGEFFAWYTDSYNADGTKTYEEVFTDEGVVGATTPVEATFEYTYDSTNPDNQNLINIYSDIRRVSNLATLRYKYNNRFGQPVFYTVKDIVLTDEECTGYQGNEFTAYCPTFRTELTFLTPGGDELKVYVAAEKEAAKIEEYENNGYTLVNSYNQITYLAPKEDVTEVYNGTVNWIVSDVNLTPAKSEVTLVATGGEPTYTVYYEMAGESGSQTGYYNDLLNIVAPDKDQNGNKFSYWYDETNEIILTYTHHYNYRIVENKTIKAVYGATNLSDWSPTIQSVTYTREFGDDHDYIYTDYLLAFTSKDGKVLNDVKAAEGISYGLLVLRDSAYYISDSKNVTYPDGTNADIQAKLTKIVTETKKSAAFTVDTVKYNCYYYDLTQYELTNFNRCDYFRQYDNRAVVGGTHSYKEYAFTSIAYVVDGAGNVYFSKPMNVNFFDLGSQKPTN